MMKARTEMNDLVAVEDDIRHAYRLLLGREPERGGFDRYKKIIASGEMTATELADSFLGSMEFASKHGHAPVEVAIDGFSMFVET